MVGGWLVDGGGGGGGVKSFSCQIQLLSYLLLSWGCDNFFLSNLPTNSLHRTSSETPIFTSILTVTRLGS